ncbi:MAG: metalloregulator ArsR/SmtB family transcription factor [Gemmatimonadota bacterium]|nr:metalloregulator ArsR/SmtB family transcription factor [Gemmatimonadota bacterium]
MIQLSDATAAAIAERFKALGEPMRLRLLQALRTGECSVGDLARRVGGGQANVSKHLQVLQAQGYVDRRKEGTTSWYRITDPQVFTMCELVCGGLEEELDRKRKLLRRRR